MKRLPITRRILRSKRFIKAVYMFNIGFGELVVIFLIILVAFGAKRLPEIAADLAKAMKTFKKESGTE